MVKRKRKKLKKGQLTIKKQIGLRFKQFREMMDKTQVELGDEFNVYQSTITNIEVGKTFPGVKYLHYLGKVYSLNADWLVNDRGEMFYDPLAISKDLYNRYKELINLMQVPVVEELMMARLEEVKVIAKDAIEIFRTLQKENDSPEKP